MSTRTFEGPDGAVWHVWEVVPGRVSEFRSAHGSHLPAELADGWLCFVSGEEKRRLAPLPADWEARSESDLRFWCRAAVPVPPRAGTPARDGTYPGGGAVAGPGAGRRALAMS